MENPRQQRGRRKPVPAFLRPRKLKPRVSSIPPAKGGKLASFFGVPAESSTPHRSARRTPSRKSADRTGVVRRPVRSSSRRKIKAVAAGVGKAALARQQAKVEFRRALRTFRPKKTERGTVVFLAAKPKGGKSERLKRGSRRKGYAVYVTTTGKVRPVRDRQPPRELRGLPVARRRGSLDPQMGRTAREKKAIEKAMFVRVRSRRGLSRLVVPSKGSSSVNWPAVKRMMTRMMAKGLAATMEAHTQVVTSVVVVAGVGTFTATTYLNVSSEQAQMKPSHEWNAFVGKANESYALIAEQLKNTGVNGMVSRGSAAFVEKIGDNQELPQSEWMDASGERWEKNECDIVDIASWSFEIGVGQVETRE